MQQFLKTCFGALIVILITSACIDKIDLKPSEPVERLVILGSIENYNKPYQVDISLTGDFGGQLERPVNNARVFLRDANGLEDELFNVAPGHYESESNATIIGEIGGTYQLIVEYIGSTYKSTTETILPPTLIDSISFITHRSQFRNDQGAIYTKEEFFLFGYFKIKEADTWLRWEIENIFVLPQIPCSPFAPNYICYVPREVENARNIPLWDGNLSAENIPITNLLQTRDIDVIYGQPQYFNVYQRRIDKEAFEYWSQVNKVLQEDESIFSIPPAAVKGNFTNIDDPDEVVLGLFEAVSVDTARVFTLPQFLNLGRTLNGICGVPGFRPWPLPVECCNCLSLPESTIDKPEWWD